MVKLISKCCTKDQSFKPFNADYRGTTSSRVRTEAHSLKSSAYMRQRVCSTNERSLTYNLNNSGPNREPFDSLLIASAEEESIWFAFL